MTDASSGNLDVKCDVASDDEFGDLSRMFNSMMDIISNNYKELSASKAALEVSEQELKKNYERWADVTLKGIKQRLRDCDKLHE